MSEHTPGPWEVTRPLIRSMQSSIVADIREGESVCLCHVDSVAGCDCGDDDANARLIARAPDMFASLTELVNSPNAKQNAMWDRARAAVEPSP